MAYIEKETLCAWLDNMGVSDFIISRIESETHFPAVDVVEVVRCKDCKYRGELDCPMYHEELQDYDDGDYVYTDVVAFDSTDDDGFCQKGERIDE